MDVTAKGVLVIHCSLAVSRRNGSPCHWIKTSQAKRVQQSYYYKILTHRSIIQLIIHYSSYTKLHRTNAAVFFRFGSDVFCFVFFRLVIKKILISVLTLLLTTTITANSEGVNIGSIISGLSQKAVGILRNVAIPVLNKQVGLVKAHIDGLLSFFQDKEGDIEVPNTPFSIHFVADRCRLLGKRLLIVDFQKCKAKATESQTGLSATCEKGSQKEAIECATEEVLNLVKLVSLALKKNEQ